MTATSEQTFRRRPQTGLAGVEIQVRDGAKDAVRFCQRFTGASLTFAAVALMLLPFGMSSTAELLSKLMVALVLGFVGAALWQSGSPMPSPELEIDMERREIRMVREVKGQRSVERRRRFADLARADFDEDTVHLYERSGDLLAIVTIRDEMGLRALRRALTDEGLVYES